MSVDPDELDTLATKLEHAGLGLLAPLVREAVAEIRRHRAGPRWTRERPTEPGWYLIRLKYDSSRSRHLARVVRDQRGRPLLACDGAGPESPEDCWFAGPLPEPAGPEET